MIKDIKLFIYPVKDLASAKILYTKLLGVEPYVDSPYYVGFKIGEYEVGLDPNGFNKGLIGGICYWEVEDIKVSLQSYIDAGATVVQDAMDVGGGKLIAWVKDADGNVTGLSQNA